MPPQAASESVAAQFTGCVRRAVAGDLPPIELIAAAEAMTGRGETALVEQLYKLWIERNPGDPLLHAIKFNYGVLLSEAGEIARAKEALGDAIRLRPDFLPPPPAYSSLRRRLAVRRLRGGGGWTRRSGRARGRRGAPTTPAATRPRAGGGCRRDASGTRCR